jgi:hypothetical protein
MKQKKKRKTVTFPSVSNGKTTGNPPTQNSRIHRRNTVANKDLDIGFLFPEVEKEIKIRQTKTPNIAITPPSFDGTPRRTA